jgi:integrase
MEECEGGMSKVAFTDRFLQTVKAPDQGRAVYIDTRTSGLELLVTATGKKQWSIRYRPRGGSRQRVGYGAYPAVKLADARGRALAIAAAAADGLDLPEQERTAAEAERKAAARPQTLRDLVNEYVEGYCKPRQRRWKLTQALLRAHVSAEIGDKPLGHLRRADIIELLDKLEHKKGMRAQVNRVRSALVAALNWAVERDKIDSNPAAGVKRRKIEAPSRSRVLSNDELRAVWKAAATLPDPSRGIVETLILTGQRRDEVRGMMWKEIDEKWALWTLPAARSKGKRDHEVPLSPAVMEVLQRQPKLGPYVFTVTGDKPYAGQKRLKEIIDRESEVSGWVLHDLRRGVSTGLAALRIPQDVIDRTLNHAKEKLASVYNVHGYRDEKRAALDAWARQVAFVVAVEEQPNTILFPARARG